MNEEKNKNKFQSNQTYFTISVYAIMTFVIACFIFQIIIYWTSTVAIIETFLSRMSSFVFGTLIAFVLNPFVKWVKNILVKYAFKGKHAQHEKACKILSILIAYAIVLGFITICLIYIIPQLISSISDLSYKLPSLYRSFSSWVINWTDKHEILRNNLIGKALDSIYPKIMEWTTKFASAVIPWLYSVSVSLVQWLVAIVFAIVISVYMISDKRIIVKATKKILFAFLPEKNARKTIDVAKNCNQIFTGYIIAKSLDSLIIGILCFIFMSVLGLPYSILISVIVGITNIIPYFGPYIGAMPGIFILAITKIHYGVEFTILILVLQQFDGLILGPRLMGDSTGVRPLLILFAILFGGNYFGVLGMFIGVPVIAVLQYLFTLLVNSRLKAKNIKNL